MELTLPLALLLVALSALPPFVFLGWLRLHSRQREKPPSSDSSGLPAPALASLAPSCSQQVVCLGATPALSLFQPKSPLVLTPPPLPILPVVIREGA